jgi:hypothetical protein
MLRLISAVLHRAVGPAVSDAALDLRPPELGFLVPLVACLLALSAWPAAVSHRAFNGIEVRATPQQTIVAALPPTVGLLRVTTGRVEISPDGMTVRIVVPSGRRVTLPRPGFVQGWTSYPPIAPMRSTP